MGYKVDPGVMDGYLNSYKNKLFGLLCEREKGGEWEKFLENLLIELEGFPEESRGINYLSLYHKLASARHLNYESFRNVIFDCMNLISKVKVQDMDIKDL